MDVKSAEKCFTDKKKVEQWLCYTSTRCDSLNSHMQYMKMLWHDIQPELLKSKGSLNSLNCHNSKTVISDNVEGTTSKQIKYNNSLEELSDNQSTSINNNDDTEKYDSCNPSLNPESILPEVNVQCKEEERTKNLDVQKEIKVEVTMITPRTYSLPQSARTVSRPLSPLEKKNKCNECNDNWQYSYENHLSEYSEGLLDVEDSKKSFKELILDNQNEILLQGLSSARNNIKLNGSNNTKTELLGKSKIRTKNDKKEKIISSALSSKKDSLCKLDDIASMKFKKRRKKLHRSNSRSTVATRDTNFLGRKNTKRRKQKNAANNHQTFKSHKISNEVVEIYNAAAKSDSTPAIHNKHSKLDRSVNYSNKLPSATNKQQVTNVKSKCENNNYQHNSNIDEHNLQDTTEKQHQVKRKAEGKGTNSHDQNCNLEITMAPSCAVEKFNSQRCQHSIIQAHCDPMITHNYEMPTLASKLKRVNRSYFSRFSFRNIPFVVGTSVTPSHNLGLNIQQVLSIMKTRQPVVNGITPLLIRKVSRGMKPVSILMEQITDQRIKLPYMNSEIIATCVQKGNSVTNYFNDLFKNEDCSLQHKKSKLSNFNLNLNPSIKQHENVSEAVKNHEDIHENCHKKKDAKSENQLSKRNTTQISQTSDNAKLIKLFSSQQNIKTQMGVPGVQSKFDQDNLSDMNIRNTDLVSHSQIDNSQSKGIREVLINLHDQFEEMNTKYEKLQEKIEKYNDKGLEDEMQVLEKELNAKEDEINAVVNLYKEVMALKQQMRLLQEKNSYVCISTEVPLGPNKTCSSMPFTLTKSYGTNFQQKLQHKRGNTIIPPREPTSLRLAGLLRQIQIFQKQLTS